MLQSNRQKRFNELGGNVEDGLYSWFKSKGYTSNSVPDLIIEWLTDLGYSSGSLEDRLNSYLATHSYAGSLVDKCNVESLTRLVLHQSVDVTCGVDVINNIAVANSFPANAKDFWIYFDGSITWASGNESTLLRAAGVGDLINIHINSSSGNIEVGDRVDSVFNTVIYTDPFTTDVTRAFKCIVSKSAGEGVKIVVDGGSVTKNAALTGAYDDFAGNATIGSHSGTQNWATGTLSTYILAGTIADQEMIDLSGGTKTLSEII